MPFVTLHSTKLPLEHNPLCYWSGPLLPFFWSFAPRVHMWTRHRKTLQKTPKLSPPSAYGDMFLVVAAVIAHVVLSPVAYAAKSTGNAQVDQLIAQVGLAAACAGTSQVAQKGGALSDVAKGALQVFCGQPTNGLMPNQQTGGVALAPIILPGGATGFAPVTSLPPLAGANFGNPLNGGMLANGGQNVANQIATAAANAAVGVAVQSAFNPNGQPAIGNVAGIVGAFNAPYGNSPYMNPYGHPYGNTPMMNPIGGQGIQVGGQQNPNFAQTFQQFAGAVAAGVITEKVLGGVRTNQANTVAGLPILRGNGGYAAPIYAPVYGPYTNGRLSNVMFPAQGAMNAPLTLYPVNTQGPAPVDTRNYDAVYGVRTPDGAAAVRGGISIGAYQDDYLEAAQYLASAEPIEY